MQRRIRTTVIFALTSGAMLAPVASAAAIPPSATGLVPLTCSTGVSITATIDTRGLPSRSAWIDGHGVAVRAFQRDESGTITLPGNVLWPYAVSFGPAITAGRQGGDHTVSATALSQTVACSGVDSFTGVPVTLTADDVALVGLDPSYVGTTVSLTGTATFTVYLAAGQLAARS